MKMITKSDSIPGKRTWTLALAAVPCLLTNVGAMAYNVDSVLVAPTEYASASTDPVTDGLMGTRWSILPSSLIVLGWDTPILADGSGTVQVITDVNLFPATSGTGFTARLLLEDGSYSSPLTHYPLNSVKQVDLVERIFISRATLNLGDLYQGPLGIVGIELSDYFIGYEDRPDEVSPFSLDLGLVRADGVTLIPEASSSLLLLTGGAVLAGRRRGSPRS